MRGATDLHAVLLAEWIERLRRLNYAPTTVRDYASIAHRFLQAFPRLSLEHVSPEHIERFLGDLPVAARSQATYLKRLGAFFAWLHRQKRLLGENPCRLVERPRWTAVPRPAPLWEEFLAVRSACRTLEEAVLVELPYFTSLRMAELRSLRVGDLDLVRRRTYVIGKYHRRRVVVFPERVAALLREFTAGRDPESWLFPSPRHPGRRRCVEWIGGTLARLGRDAGLHYRLTEHILRHGFARLCKTRGVPLEVISRLMGHASIATTAHMYGHLDEDDLQAAYDRALKDPP